MRSRFSKFLFSLLFLTSSIVLVGQGCSNSNMLFRILNSSNADSASGSGNGTTYDGKLVFYNLVSNFTCENKSAPKSILTRENGVWTLVENTTEKCANSSTVLSDVVYSGSSNFLTYNGTSYSLELNAPIIPTIREFNVTPTLSASSPDAQPGDGVCADSNNECSLQAAIDETNSADQATIINLAAGTYNVTNTLKLLIQSTVQLQGVSNSNSVISGGANTSILETGDTTTKYASRIIKGVGFVNGYGAGGYASALNAIGSVRISDSRFQNNSGSPTIFAGVLSNDIILEDSIISQSGAAAGIQAHSSSSLNILRSEIFNCNGGGVIADTVSHFSIKQSSIYNNGAYGALITKFMLSGLIENTTFSGNFIGIFITFNYNSPDFTIRNTTVKDPSTGFYSLRIDNGGSSHVLLQNSILSNASSGHGSCNFLSNSSTANIIAQNSIVDDNTCGTSGIMIANPLLQAMALNGGPTHTMMPQTGSPAIDAGNNLFCPSYDQRGSMRPVDSLGGGAICDIGAVEVQ